MILPRPIMTKYQQSDRDNIINLVKSVLITESDSSFNSIKNLLNLRLSLNQIRLHFNNMKNFNHDEMVEYIKLNNFSDCVIKIAIVISISKYKHFDRYILDPEYNNKINMFMNDIGDLQKKIIKCLPIKNKLFKTLDKLSKIYNTNYIKHYVDLPDDIIDQLIKLKIKLSDVINNLNETQLSFLIKNTPREYINTIIYESLTNTFFKKQLKDLDFINYLNLIYIPNTKYNFKLKLLLNIDLISLEYNINDYSPMYLSKQIQCNTNIVERLVYHDDTETISEKTNIITCILLFNLQSDDIVIDSIYIDDCLNPNNYYTRSMLFWQDDIIKNVKDVHKVYDLLLGYLLDKSGSYKKN